jgi:signal transduction histidine kinase
MEARDVKGTTTLGAPAAGPPMDRSSATLRAVFPGESEMAARCREFDWGSTPLGPVAGWSNSLRTTVGIVLTSRQPMFLWWGPELVQLYNDGYRPSLGTGGRADHALGARGREFWTDIWDAIGPQIDQVMTTGEATWHENQYLPIERNGHLEDVWWTYSYSPVRDDDGRIAATLVVCQETTARVQAERDLQATAAALAAERAQLKKIVDQAPAFMAVLRGPEHRFERSNAEYDRLIGRPVRPGLSVAEVVPEIVDQGFIPLLDGVLETGEPFVGRAIPVRLIRTPDGPPEQRYVDFVYQALTEADGTRSGVFVHGVDVTDAVEARRQIERLLAESERARAEAEAARREAEAARGAAEAASRAKGEFLAVMSHELRTPLNAIGGYAELIELGVHGPVTDGQREALTRIQRSQRALLSVINEVLNYTRLETGAVTYEITSVPVAEAVGAAEVLVSPQLRAKGLTYGWDGCAPGVAVRADRDKLQQILLNVLSNAIKFTEPRDGEPGRITVQCECAPAGEGDARVRIHVRDTGVGIAADKLDAVFEPFVQVDQRLAREHNGTGLGLAISRDLARAMGGDLTVASAPGEGSTFTLTLPRA